IVLVTRAAANFYISRPFGRRKADENRLHFLLGGNGPPRTETSHYCAAGCCGRGRVGAPPADRPPRGAAGAARQSNATRSEGGVSVETGTHCAAADSCLGRFGRGRGSRPDAAGGRQRRVPAF